MARVIVRHNIEGYYQLRSAPGVVAKLEAMGRAALADTGGESAGYAMDSRQGRKNPQGRWRVSVAAISHDARRDNEANNTLVRALGAAGSA